MSIAFDRAAGYYDESRGIPREVEEQAADRVEAAVGPAARLLEMGVGTGRVALPLHRRGRQVVGVDLSLPMLERYRAKAAAAGLPPPSVLRADASRLPFRDACVDVVLEVHLLHLVPAWERALHEARRVLAPGGMLLHGSGGAYQRGSGSPRDQVIRRFDELAAAGGGPGGSGRRRPPTSGPPWSPSAARPRRWSRSSGSSGRPTPRPWRGRGPDLLLHLAPPRPGLPHRRGAAAGRAEARHPTGNPTGRAQFTRAWVVLRPEVSHRRGLGMGWEP